MVLTHENRWRKVIRTMSRDFDGTIYNIQTYCAAEQWLTGEHPVLTVNPRTGQRDWVKAEELVPGKRIQMNGPRRYHNLMILPKLTGDDHVAIDMGTGMTDLDPELAYFLGIFVSEGSFKFSEKGLPSRVCLSLNNGKDKSFIPRLEAVAKRFSDAVMHVHERPLRHTIDIYWSDKSLASALLALCGAGAVNKRIPSMIFQGNRQVRQAFFDGLIDGDGSRKQTQICLRMVSKNVVYGMRYIAASLGLVAKVFESKTANRLTCYQIAWSTNPRYRRYLEDDENFYLPLRKVDTKHYKGLVYNIAVEEDHSYITQFAVHNCELYRVMIPFKHLIDQGYKVGWCSSKDLVDTSMYDWDVLVLPRLGLATYDESDLFIKAMRQHGKAIVYELDDDFVHLPEDNPAHQADNQAIHKMTHLMKAADLITVSTPTLAKVMKDINPNIVTLQNCIDPDMWAQVEREQERVIPNLTIGMHGGNSHHEDWRVMAEVFPVIARKYPEVKIVISGYQPDYLLDLGINDHLIKIEWTPVKYYHAAVFQIDIGLCPLLDTEFNRSKSIIKALETGILGRPVIASPTVYGEVIQHNSTGFIAHTPDDWIKYISRLVENPRLRRRLGSNLRGRILAKYNIHKEAWRWMKAYQLVWDKTRTRA